MTRDEFMRRLAAQLADLPADERQAALDYYNEYLDEAGPEGQAEAIRLLGSPEDVAAQIHAGHSGADWAAGYTGADADAGYGTCLGDDAPTGQPVYKTRPDGASGKLLWLLLAIATFPLWIGAIGVVFGILGAAVGIVVAGIVLAVSGVAVGIASIPLLSVAFASGLVNIGIALLLTALGLVLLAGCFWVCIKGIPTAVQWCKELINKIKGKVSSI